jgi:hypothetical protein
MPSATTYAFPRVSRPGWRLSPNPSPLSGRGSRKEDAGITRRGCGDGDRASGDDLIVVTVEWMDWRLR